MPVQRVTDSEGFLPDCPGIYAILNKVNGRRGVGLSTRSIKARVRQHLHLLRKAAYHLTPLQRDALDMGIEVFEFQALEICLPQAGLNLRRHLQAREGWWATQLGTLDEYEGYNLEAGGRRSPASLFRERERRLIKCVPARYQLLPSVTLDQPIERSLLQFASLSVTSCAPASVGGSRSEALTKDHKSNQAPR